MAAAEHANDVADGFAGSQELSRTANLPSGPAEKRYACGMRRLRHRRKHNPLDLQRMRRSGTFCVARLRTFDFGSWVFSTNFALRGSYPVGELCISGRTKKSFEERSCSLVGIRPRIDGAIACCLCFFQFASFAIVVLDDSHEFSELGLDSGCSGNGIERGAERGGHLARIVLELFDDVVRIRDEFVRRARDFSMALSLDGGWNNVAPWPMRWVR